MCVCVCVCVCVYIYIYIYRAYFVKDNKSFGTDFCISLILLAVRRHK